MITLCLLCRVYCGQSLGRVGFCFLLFEVMEFDYPCRLLLWQTSRMASIPLSGMVTSAIWYLPCQITWDFFRTFCLHGARGLTNLCGLPGKPDFRKNSLLVIMSFKRRFIWPVHRSMHNTGLARLSRKCWCVAVVHKYGGTAGPVLINIWSSWWSPPGWRQQGVLNPDPHNCTKQVKQSLG